MNKFRKYTLCLCMAVIAALLMNLAVYADNYEFTIDGPDSCGVGDTVEVTVTLTADEELEDSDAFLVYDTDYFDYVDSDSDEYDEGNGTVRLRGSFTQDSYSCSWTVELLATEEGTAEFEITDKWVKNADGQVVTSTADGFSMEIGEAGSAPVSDNGDGDLAEAIYFDSSFSFHFAEPEEVPTCFDETTTEISGVSCKAWKFNSEMNQKVDYSADPADFYAVYGYIDSENDACWYVYDAEGDSLQRLLMLQDVEIEKTEEPVVTDEATEEGSPAIINNITKLMIIAFVALVVLIIVINVIFSNLEKKSRKKRIEERQRLSREELKKKREIENKIQEKRQQEAQSQNMRRPDGR